MSALRYISATLALLQVAWAAALGVGGLSAPRWAAIVGAVLGAAVGAFPALSKSIESRSWARIVSASLVFVQSCWAAALLLGGPLPAWAPVVGAVLAATASAFPSLFGAAEAKK